MRRLTSLLLILACTGPVHAAGLDLRWDDCPTSGGVADITLDCFGAQSGGHDLYGSFALPSPMDSFFVFEFTIDVTSTVDPLPSFWQFGSGECNTNQLVSTGPEVGDCHLVHTTPCTRATACQMDVSWISRFPESHRARLLGLLLRDREDSVPLAAETDYYAFTLRFSTLRATEGGGACAGCCDELALVWTSARATGSSPGGLQAIDITTPGAIGNRVAVNTTQLCGATPTHSHTWGQIKAFYR